MKMEAIMAHERQGDDPTGDIKKMETVHQADPALADTKAEGTEDRLKKKAAMPSSQQGQQGGKKGGPIPEIKVDAAIAPVVQDLNDFYDRIASGKDVADAVAELKKIQDRIANIFHAAVEAAKAPDAPDPDGPKP